MNTRIKKEAIKYAEENLGIEVCGLFCYDNLGVPLFQPIKNKHNSPHHSFLIDVDDFLYYKMKYNIYGIFHSHISDSVNFSKIGDISLSEEMAIPIFLYNIKLGVWKEHMPEYLDFSLDENPFCWGLFDCYSMIRFYYWKNLDVLLPDFDRDDPYGTGVIIHDENGNETTINEKSLSDIGFVKVNNLQNHDLIISESIFLKYNHMGIYCDGKYYDHKINRLSEISTFRPINKMMIFRYKNFV